MKYRTTFKLAALLALLAVLLISLYALNRFFGAPQSRVNLDQASVVLEMRSLNRLETAAFTIEKIIEAGTDSGALKEFFVGDRILLIAHGEVIAGVDLSKLTEEDVEIDGGITITLPAPEILVSRLDNEKTRVYDRDTGLFTEGDKELESEARAKAEESIRKAACDAGILTMAGENAKKQVEVMLRGMGVGEVRVVVREGVCG